MKSCKISVRPGRTHPKYVVLQGDEDIMLDIQGVDSK